MDGYNDDTGFITTTKSFQEVYKAISFIVDINNTQLI